MILRLEKIEIGSIVRYPSGRKKYELCGFEFRDGRWGYGYYACLKDNRGNCYYVNVYKEMFVYDHFFW